MKRLPLEYAKLIEQAIQAAQAAGDLPDFEIPNIIVQPAKRAKQGDYACPVAMALASVARRRPLDIAQTIVDHLPEAEFIASVEVAPPGFINFRLNEAYLKKQVETIIAEGDNLFTLEIGENQRAQVEFVSANPTGPVTIGRTRGGVIGDTMARLLEAAGYEVQREYYFNNAGRQMMMLGQSLKARYLQALGQDVDLPEGGYQGDYLEGFAEELVEQEGNKLVDADWQPFKEFAEMKMFEWIKRSLASVDITHDNFFNEDSLFQDGFIWQVLDELKAAGHIYEAAEWEGATDQEKAAAEGKDPAQWFRSSQFGDSKDRVLVKSDGIPTYTLPDIAYHKNKIERGFDLLVNVLGADHGQQYKVVQYGIAALGLDPSKIHVIINQMVRTVRDGKEVKMSTRRGVYDTLDDLVEATSADAIRYHMLARSPTSHLDFDVDAVVQQNNENPVYYIQNAHVRCAGIFREAEARGLSDENVNLDLLSDDELTFIRKALELGEAIDSAVNTFEPHKIAFYAQDLAAVFHPIYDNVRVLHSEVPEDVAKARLRFYRAAQVVFKRVLYLMGMTAPERM